MSGKKIKKSNKQASPSTLHAKINNGLTIVVIAVGLYIFAMPFWPQISYVGGKATGKYSDEIKFKSTSNSNSPDNNQGNTQNINIPEENTLLIPQIGLENIVHESDSASILQKGIWHRPKTSTPDKGGNTVLVAHRFMYNSPATFYHLDKLKAGDQIALSWNKKQYNYKIKEIKIVEPTEISIEKPTSTPTLTLYTCTPLWTAKQRLVVIAELIEDESEKSAKPKDQSQGGIHE